MPLFQRAQEAGQVRNDMPAGLAMIITGALVQFWMHSRIEIQDALAVTGDALPSDEAFLEVVFGLVRGPAQNIQGAGTEETTMTGDFRFFDTSAFPVVTIQGSRLPAGYAPQWIAEMDLLVGQPEPFAFVFLDGVENPTHEDQKAQTLWLKQNKDRLASVCRGAVSVEPDLAKRLLRPAQALAITAAFGLRFAVASEGRKPSAVRASCLRAKRSMTPSSGERRYLRFGRFRIRIPRSRALRLALGVALLIRGVLPPAGPVLLPAALTLLSADVPWLRRMRRRLIVRLGRSRRKPQRLKTGPALTASGTRSRR